MKNSFKVSYVTTLPREGNAPRVTITGNIPHRYKVTFSEILNDFLDTKLISEGYCTNNQTIIGKCPQWFINWVIKVYDETGDLVFKDVYYAQDEVVFIKIDAWALGDTLAWIPYVELFRIEQSCQVICSTFYNQLLVDAYPKIMFVKPNTVIENVYAQYYVGAGIGDNPYYSPINVNEHPLQDVANMILGTGASEIKPDLTIKYAHRPSRLTDKYVTLSEYGSAENKHWKAENGWQRVVDYLNEKGYKVLVISKEKTQLTGVIDLTGNISLDERAVDMMHAEFHLGVSSGLSWLAWSLDTHVVMISDVTPNWHEFKTNITRLNANELDRVNYLAEGVTSVEEVLKKLGELIVS